MGYKFFIISMGFGETLLTLGVNGQMSSLLKPSLKLIYSDTVKENIKTVRDIF